MAKTEYDPQYSEVMDRLRACGNNCSCSEIRKLLESLGFKVKPDNDGGGHKTFSHPLIKSFHGGNYNCGHGRNPDLTDVYIKKIIKTLKSIESEFSNKNAKHPD